ncbi:cardiolipin synthase ClsB [Azohydromonas caseinilytica]|uniref:Cardiolipin synthase B n=1 Tax=Azohydromonas caseinilytica TaxID=2728836 RepID=A0A848F7S1_9BURK|nr:cardiolipin synthase ClsB [Azohydromonas caseinilytica]NML14765.1 cardiolipin synthase ClsB [Azohydromonas caseinilytica]
MSPGAPPSHRRRGGDDDAAHASALLHNWYDHPRALFCGGNEVKLLRGGCELFPAMCEAIAAARHEVWLATYIFHDDEAGRLVADALVAAARRGVRVHVVVDGFGSKASLPALQQWLAPAGVELAVFRPVRRWWTLLQPGQLRRLHQKLCVVDGELGFVGGINIIDDCNDLNHGYSEAPRLDYAVAVRGPVVGPVQQTARAMWSRAAFGHDWPEEMKALARSSEPVARVRALLRRLRITPPLKSLACSDAERPVRAAFVVRDNLRQRRAIERSYIDALRRARTRIDLVSPYFYPGHLFRRTLRDAARRGVQVRLLLQGKLDYRIAGLAAQVLYDELLRHGVRIFEYTPAFLHAKIALVDDDWATVGSSNIDPLSLLLNLEANVMVRDPDFVRELAAEFNAAIAVSREVQAAQVRARGFWGALRRGFVAWSAHVYLRVAGITGRY